MEKYFKELFALSNVSVENDVQDGSQTPYGRFEVKSTEDGPEIHTFFGDMKTYESDSVIDIGSANYDDIDTMIDHIANDRMSKAMATSMRLTSNLVDVKIKVKRSLSQRMADIEYPVLSYLYRNRIPFVLLNPNKGTLKRAQAVYVGQTIDIYTTCHDDENYPKYMEDLTRVNERLWPVHRVSFSALPRGLTYYGGFTVRQYLDSNISFIGYEMNPKHVVMTYDGHYELFSGKDAFGQYDSLEVQRDVHYTYRERYYHDEDRCQRYFSDYLYTFLRNETKYFYRPYLFMYNVITNVDIGMDMKSEVVKNVKGIIGYFNNGGFLNSPYDNTSYEVEECRFAQTDYGIEKIITTVVPNGYDDLPCKLTTIGYEEVKFSTPFIEIHPIDYHLSNFYNYYCLHKSRQPLFKNSISLDTAVVIFQNEKFFFCPVPYQEVKKDKKFLYRFGILFETSDVRLSLDVLAKKAYPKAIGALERVGKEWYYKGDMSDTIFSQYVVNIAPQDSIHVLKRSIRISVPCRDWYQMKFVLLETMKDSEILSISITVPSGKKVLYYWEGAFYDGTSGKVVDPVIFNKGNWMRGDQCVPVREFAMIKCDTGPISVMNQGYLPMHHFSYPLVKWRSFLRQYNYLHYYSGNEYKLLENTCYPDDDVASTWMNDSDLA